MEKTMYYKNNSGSIITSDEVERAFHIVSGKYRYKDESGYLRFLYKLLGKTIVEVVSPNVDDFIEQGNTFLAVKLYREEHGCTLSEAKAAIDKKIKLKDVC